MTRSNRDSRKNNRETRKKKKEKEKRNGKMKSNELQRKTERMRRRREKVGRFRGDLGGRRWNREEVLENKSTASTAGGRGVRSRREEEGRFTILSRGHFFSVLSVCLPPASRKTAERRNTLELERQRERERERERKRNKRVVEGAEDKKVKQKADYVTRGMKYGGWQRRGWNETRPDTIG